MKPAIAAAAALIAFAATVPGGQGATLNVARPEVQAFVAEMRREHGFHAQDLVWILRDAVPQPRIVEIMQRPAESSTPWWRYRQQFLTSERIEGGVRIWNEHRAALEAIAAQSGVAPQYLVAITGVESFYGRITGGYRVLDALATLGFDYPPRADYFRRELTQLLLLAREEGVDPRSLRGSYAGAMGIAQFMPSSYRRYAADGNGDGQRDLWTWNPDVFASVANYFREHGWRPGEPVLSDATHDASPDDPAKAEAALKYTVADLKQSGYRFDTELPDDARAMLVPAQLEEGTAWRVGYQNFYTITRYNRSFMYAMAVSDLADAIAARFKATAVPVAATVSAAAGPAAVVTP
jgi:membrane-bound lytic murein transglycosylase B